MHKKGKIYFTDRELTDAEVEQQYVYPCMFFVSETLVNEAGEPYDILKHIVYNRFGIKSVRVYGGGGGGGDQDLSSVLANGNIMDNDIFIEDDFGFNKVAGDSLGIAISDKYDDNSGKYTELTRVVDSNNDQQIVLSTDFITNNPYYNVYLRRKNAGIDSEATFVYDITRGIFSDKDFSSGYVNNSFVQYKWVVDYVAANSGVTKLDMITTSPQSVASQVTFNGQLKYNPTTTTDIASVLVKTSTNDIKQATSVNIIDIWEGTSYPTSAQLTTNYPNAAMVMCPNTATRRVYLRNGAFWTYITTTDA